jgi:hypothetical protein
MFLVLGYIYFVSCENESINHLNKTSEDSLMTIVPSAKLFYKHQIEFNEIVTQLYKSPLINKKRTLLFFTPNHFGPSLQNKMEKIGITKLIYYTKYCDSLAKKGIVYFEFDFITNWKASVPVHITKEPCNNDYNMVGGYFKRDNGNEGWGLGDNWVIWYEHFPTSNKSKTYSP